MEEEFVANFDEFLLFLFAGLDGEAFCLVRDVCFIRSLCWVRDGIWRGVGVEKFGHFLLDLVGLGC